MAITEPPLTADASLVPTAGPSRLTRWLSATGAVGACAAGLAFVSAVDPNSATNPYPRCLLKATTGIDCPGCGGTRSLYALLHGDVAGALDHNVLTLIVVPLVLYVAVRYALSQFDISLPAARLRPWMGTALAVFLVAFTVVRNIPDSPFWYLNSQLG